MDQANIFNRDFSKPLHSFSPLWLKMMFSWHQNYLNAAKKACHQGSSWFFKNLQFLVLAMPG
jgi:hypothetical protein